MRLAFSVLVASAALPLSAQIVFSDVQLQTSWRTASSGPAEHVVTHTELVDYVVLRGGFNNTIAEASFWPGEFFNSIGPFAG